MGVATDTIIDEDTELAATEAQIIAFDRRRAGRQEVSPVLVPLLRQPAQGTGTIEMLPTLAETPYRDFLESDPFHDQMAPARGILLGLCISMLFWGAVGYTIFR